MLMYLISAHVCCRFAEAVGICCEGHMAVNVFAVDFMSDGEIISSAIAGSLIRDNRY